MILTDELWWRILIATTTHHYRSNQYYHCSAETNCHTESQTIPTLPTSQQPATSNLTINSPVKFSIVWGSQLLPCANQLDLKTWGKESKVKRLSWKLIQQCMAAIECWPPTHMFTFHCSTWYNSYPNYNDNHCTSWNTELYMKSVTATEEVATWLCDFHTSWPTMRKPEWSATRL